MACAVPQARPSKGSIEREPQTQGDVGNPVSRWAEVKTAEQTQRRPNRT
jgi:hypothetical protein